MELEDTTIMVNEGDDVTFLISVPNWDFSSGEMAFIIKPNVEADDDADGNVTYTATKTSNDGEVSVDCVGADLSPSGVRRFKLTHTVTGKTRTALAGPFVIRAT